MRFDLPGMVLMPTNRASTAPESANVFVCDTRSLRKNAVAVLSMLTLQPVLTAIQTHSARIIRFP